jgi:hypothetical protein
MRRLIAGVAVAALLGVAGWQGYEYWQRRQAQDQGAAYAPGGTESRASGGDIVTVDEPTATDPNQGATPMAQRVAVVGLLNKRNGTSRDLTLKPGQAVRVGDAIVRLRACETTAPWEQEQLTGAFVQLDVRQLDNKWKRMFSGWVYKERPALNVVLHPVYDVWAKSCAMTFPDSGPESESVAASAPAPRRSSAPKSAAPAAAPTVAPPPPPVAAPSPNAAANN